MASDDGLCPSFLDPSLFYPSALSSSLLPPPPSSHRPARHIPAEIYNQILRYVFSQHLLPIPIENRLDEPPSLSHLLPLTLVSKVVRELALPFLYHHVTIHREEDWIQLFDPSKGFFAEEEGMSRKRWIKKLSFPRGQFPISSWTPSRYQSGPPEEAKPGPIVAPLDFSGLEKLKEVYIGDWGGTAVGVAEVQAVVDVEHFGGGPFRDSLIIQYDEGRLRLHGTFYATWLPDEMGRWISRTRSTTQTSSLLNLLSQLRPSLLHTHIENFPVYDSFNHLYSSLDFTLHPARGFRRFRKQEDARDFLINLRWFKLTFPTSRFNLDLAFDPQKEGTKTRLLEYLKAERWAKDREGWWTRA